jgi:hypothetical protein
MIRGVRSLKTAACLRCGLSWVRFFRSVRVSSVICVSSVSRLQADPRPPAVLGHYQTLGGNT